MPLQITKFWENVIEAHNLVAADHTKSIKIESDAEDEVADVGWHEPTKAVVIIISSLGRHRSVIVTKEGQDYA